MSERFIRTSGGLVNLRHVRQIDEQKDRTVAVTDHGDRHVVYEHNLDALTEILAVVPAAVAVDLVEIAYLGEFAESGEDDFIVERAPIVAWIVGDMGYPWPVAAGLPCGFNTSAIASNTEQFIAAAAGGFREVGYDGVLYGTLDEAKAAVKKKVEAQEEARRRMAER